MYSYYTYQPQKSKEGKFYAFLETLHEEGSQISTEKQMAIEKKDNLPHDDHCCQSENRHRIH